MESNVTKNTQHIYWLIEKLVNFGVDTAVISPGSRSAPLTIGFAKQKTVHVISVVDERSAAYIALGIAEQQQKPVALVCTSGTAALNLSPAVAEAFYQQIPLIILTADRPKELIDQWDGQTIHQENLYGKNVKNFVNFTADHVSNKCFLENLHNWLGSCVQAPIHLNVPISEPFYPKENDEIPFTTAKKTKVDLKQAIINNKQEQTLVESDWQLLKNQLKHAEKIMILCGQHAPSPSLSSALEKIPILLVGDITSNQHAVKHNVHNCDRMFTKAAERLKPDFLISLGRSIVSKEMKEYLRQFKPQFHWHIGFGLIGDPFNSLTHTCNVSSEYFFNQWAQRKLAFSDQSSFIQIFTSAHTDRRKKILQRLSRGSFNYFEAVQLILSSLSSKDILHLGNSMPVRIANILGIDTPEIEVMSNRGVSGIDGSLSTAVGHALGNPNKNHTIIIGDLAFFYDRNGLWLNVEFPKNLRIIILNDFGGGIFNIIPGPSTLSSVNLFTTPHKRTAEYTAKEFDLCYYSVNSDSQLKSALKKQKTCIIEVFTDMSVNKKFYEEQILTT